MDSKRRIVPFLVIVSVSAIAAARVGARQASGPGRITGEHGTEMIGYLRPILRSNGYAGRVFYSGTCRQDGFPEFVGFPAISVRSPEANKPVLMASRQVFAADAGVRVIQENHKILSVSIGKPSTSLLQTRISVLRITQMAAYNPTFVIGAVEATREVQAALARLGLRVPVGLSAQLLATPGHGQPHFPRVLNNVTVDQGLDLIAVKFHGIVTYGTCTRSDGKGLVEIEFVGLGVPPK